MPKDPYRYFRLEARELLDALTQGILVLEKGGAARETVSELLRYAHTFKGAARVVRQSKISELSHEIEGLLMPYRQAAAPPPRSIINNLLDVLDRINVEVRSLERPPSTPKSEVATPAATEQFRSIAVDVVELDGLLRSISEAGVRAVALRGAVSDFKDKVETFAAAEHVPVTTGQLEEVFASLRHLHRELSIGADHIVRALQDVQERVGELRLLPARTVFTVLERAARDIARTEGKEVQFMTRGGEYRLDARTLRGVSDALVHVVRNAIAHGIESPEDRERAGKSREGRIELDVRRELEQVVFTCADDGRGVNVEKISELAAAKGLISRDEARRLDRAGAMHLALKGGVSTSSTITELSGRGIGLEAVQTIVHGLKGAVRFVTDHTPGLKLELRVPVSLESLHVLGLRLGEQKLALPLDAVQGTRRFERAAIAPSGAKSMLLVDGAAHPLLALANLWPAAGPRKSDAGVVVMVSSGGRTAALRVDEIYGRERVVMQPLPAALNHVGLVLGACMDPKGTPIPVLSPVAVVAAAYSARPAPDVSAQASPRKPVALVIDDSLTTRILEQSILEGAGYEVDLAISGDEGLKKARARRYDIFIVDIEMPGIDGFEFITRIRSDPELRSIPAVLVTSRSSSEDKLKGKRVGAQGYIAKGEFEERQFLRIIGGLVNSPVR